LIERQQGNVRYLQFGHFQQFPELIHGSFTRLGGVSETPIEGLNVSVSSGDALENVIRNRLLVLKSLQIEQYPCATIWMVHGSNVAVLDGDGWDDWRNDWPYRSYDVDGEELIWTSRPRRKADAIITRKRGVTLAMSSADCVPILLYDPMQRAIGLAHAGWRGTARGIAAITINAMREQFDSRPEDIYAGIGPSIGPCCYEVSEDVRRLFYGEQDFEDIPVDERYRNLVRESAVFFTKEYPAYSTLQLDLWETNRKQLLLAGLLPEHIELPDVCTCCEKERFYSHRGEQGKAGRFPSVLALRREE
jgi:YfiH family protein